MAREYKDLLIKDLCTRLPSGIYVLADAYKTFDGGIIGKVIGVNLESGLVYLEGVLTPFSFDEIKPYLRKMSSMTEEEREEINDLNMNPFSGSVIDYLNARHIDYRNLIPKGLALEALPGMYSE